jgi:hypothetical protein
MIHNWNVIEADFARELLFSYINGSGDFDGKVLEIQCLSNVVDETGCRYFLDRYTNRLDYSSYDPNQAYLSTMGIDDIIPNSPANWVTLSEMKKTTPIPQELIPSSEELSKKIDKLTSNPFEKKMVGKLLGKLEVLAANSLVSTAPQYQFMPIVDSQVWDKVWKFIIIGEPIMSGMDTSQSGYWFTINEDGKYKRTHDKSDWESSKKYLRIRALDLEDYNKEVKSVLSGKAITLEHGLDINKIV